MTVYEAAEYFYRDGCVSKRLWDFIKDDVSDFIRMVNPDRHRCFFVFFISESDRRDMWGS